MVLNIIYSCIIGFFFNPVIHDFHFSTFEINKNQESNSLEITSHIFIDDLELELNEKLYLKDSSFNNDRIYKYITENLQIYIGNDILPFSYLGIEMSDDLSAFWIYSEGNLKNASTKNIIIKNTILNKSFNDQRNLITLLINGKKKTSKMLSVKENEFSIDL